MSEYKEVDVPFCVLCSRFMVIYIGEIKVMLNHESDLYYLIRTGKAYKCPQCGHIVIYKWDFKPYKIINPDSDRNYNYWYIFLEDHTHYNKYHAKK